MKGSVGTSTSIYHTRLPHQRKLERMSRTFDLSKSAKLRVSWLTHYRKHANATVTCRRFGISRNTLYKWAARYAERGPRGLEDLSRAPKTRRISKVPWQTVDLICSIRKEQPAWSKHKIAVILARDHGVSLSTSTVGRVLSRKGLYQEKKSLKRRRAARKRAAKLRADKWMKDLYPGSLVQIDTKHLRFAGQRYYQFTAVDCFTRVGFIQVSSGISSTAGKESLEPPCRVHAVRLAGRTDRQRV